MRPSRHSGEAMLVARLAAGDREAPLEQLYDAYGGRLYALDVHLFAIRRLADDLVRETFVRVRRSADGSTCAASVRTSSSRLARCAAADSGMGPTGPRADAAREPDTEDAAGTAAYAALVRLDVGDALASLSRHTVRCSSCSPAATSLR